MCAYASHVPTYQYFCVLIYCMSKILHISKVLHYHNARGKKLTKIFHEGQENCSQMANSISHVSIIIACQTPRSPSLLSCSQISATAALFQIFSCVSMCMWVTECGGKHFVARIHARPWTGKSRSEEKV